VSSLVARTVKQAQPVALERQPLLLSLLLDFSRAEMLSNLSLNPHLRMANAHDQSPQAHEYSGFTQPHRQRESPTGTQCEGLNMDRKEKKGKT